MSPFPLKWDIYIYIYNFCLAVAIFLFSLLFLETQFHSIIHSGWFQTHDPPASTSQVVKFTNTCYHTQLAVATVCGFVWSTHMDNVCWRGLSSSVVNDLFPVSVGVGDLAFKLLSQHIQKYRVHLVLFYNLKYLTNEELA